MTKDRLALLCLPVLLAACQSTNLQGPPQDGYRPGQQAPSIISEYEFEQLREQLISARSQRQTLVTNLPRVTDPATRSEHIRSIGMLEERIRMLEYRLRAAGRPVR